MVRASVVVLAVALLFAFAATARADYEAGASAFQSGDYVNALAAWRPLAEEGNARAQFGIAVIFEEGGGVARDFAQAALWYREAANQGLVDAQFNLGNLYRRGQGVQKDARRAVFWYLKAATQGMAPAQYNLALSYETGSGAAQNYTVAAKWYRMAAEQGDVDAQIGLAGLYRFGLGIEKDIDHARALFEMAAAQGDPRARFHLEAMDAKMAAAPPAPAAPEPEPQVEPEPEPEVTATVSTVAPETIVEGFGVQLAAYRRLGGAEEAWAALQADHPDLLSDQDPAFYRTKLADGSGDVFRLVAGGFESKVAADDLCRRLKQRGIDCFVPRP
ncbi:MAG: SPOR domain-containing protein [Pseudomonadota bacterium]|nr:SPOR domain-containing protein [Pseudomonadota bacterium]